MLKNLGIFPETRNGGRKSAAVIAGANGASPKRGFYFTRMGQAPSALIDTVLEYAQTLDQQRPPVKAFFPIPVIPGRRPAPKPAENQPISFVMKRLKAFSV
jgi:hypothetical protein